jgi:lipopolysaccharide transport system ATP-binding protein
MSSEVALSVAALSKCYQIYARPQDRLLQSLWRGRRRYYREFWALRDVSFELARGEAVAVIGRNGSGKSTLLQLIAGTLAPTTGAVRTAGRVAALLELGSGFNAEFTGRENVAMNAAILGLDGGEIRRRMPEIEAFADIGDFIDQPVKTYSSGMLMRLAFAVSVSVEPEILIVDEALAVGDIVFQFRCLERLARLVGSGTTLLFVSHDLTTVRAFCSRAVYLEAGRVKAIGSAEEIAEAYVSDTQEARKRDRGAAPGVPARTHGGPGVLSARFADAAGAAYAHGDAIELEVELDAGGLARPALSALIQDRRLVSVAGAVCTLERAGAGRTRVRFSARALFAAGHYFVTLRLEERLGDGSFIQIDKQVGILAFEVMRGTQRTFLGLVDVG